MEILHTFDREYTRNVVPIIELEEEKPEKPEKKKEPKKKPAKKKKKKGFDKGAFLEETALEAEDCKPPFCLPQGQETARRNEEQKKAEDDAERQARFVALRRKWKRTTPEFMEVSHEDQSGKEIIKDWAAEKDEKHKARCIHVYVCMHARRTGSTMPSVYACMAHTYIYYIHLQ